LRRKTRGKTNAKSNDYNYLQAILQGGVIPPLFLLLFLCDNGGCHQTDTHTTAQAERRKMLNLNQREKKEKVIEHYFNRRFHKLPNIQDWSDKELDEWISYIHLMVQGEQNEKS
jgi:hypothetical protein